MSYNSDIARLREVLGEFQNNSEGKNSGKIALAFSHQIEDTIALDLALKRGLIGSDSRFLR